MVQGEIREYLETRGFEHLPYDGPEEHWWKEGRHVYVSGPTWRVHTRSGATVTTVEGRGLLRLKEMVR